MKVWFTGGTHAAITMAEAARRRGFELSESADLWFVSMDTPTDHDGNRDLAPIYVLVREALDRARQVVLTSQVPPGFARSFNAVTLWNMAETLRMEDAQIRAMHPEMFIIGSFGDYPVYGPLKQYLEAFDCPILHGSYEDCEFAKIAINLTLASQVENANRLAKAAEHFKADWSFVQRVLRHDSRIGPRSYLTPGSWSKSSHLLRDYRTLANAGL